MKVNENFAKFLTHATGVNTAMSATVYIALLVVTANVVSIVVFKDVVMKANYEIVNEN
jgi:hypothetical protein